MTLKTIKITKVERLTDRKVLTAKTIKTTKCQTLMFLINALQYMPKINVLNHNFLLFSLKKYF